ncbi:MAG: hypothetical protein MJ208_03595 [Bacilli bacterium]|nr:hypothetical protein [Bacilli bacterium]
MNNNIKTKLAKANVNYKRALIVTLSINVALITVMIVTYIFTNNHLFFIPYLFLIVLIDAICFYRFFSSYQHHLEMKSKEVTNLFRYLYLDLNNQIKVKLALINLKERASLKMVELLDQLINETNDDSSLTPYIKFASNFSSTLVEEVMLALFRYQIESSPTKLKQFNEAYFKLKRVVELEEEKTNKRQYDFIKTTAIIGTAMIVVLVIIATVIVVEEYIHG